MVVDCVVVVVEVVDAVAVVVGVTTSVPIVVETVGNRVDVVVSVLGMDVLWSATVTSVVVVVVDTVVVVVELVSTGDVESVVDVVSLRPLDGDGSVMHPVSNNRKHKHSVAIRFIIEPFLCG